MIYSSLGDWGSLAQGVGQIALAIIGFFTAKFAIREYREKGQVAKAKWQSDLFKQFFADSTYKDIRQQIDFDDLGEIKILIARELEWHRSGATITFSRAERDTLDKFTDFLNFFEFVGLLRKSGQLTDEDIGSLFDYYIARIVEIDRDNQIRLYLNAFKFRNLCHLLNRVSDYLFVYGTLKQGFSRHKFIFEASMQLVGTARAHGVLYELPRKAYPAARFEKSEMTVEGELYRIPAERSSVLDQIDVEEGVPEGLYARRLITARVGDVEYPSWAYGHLRIPPDATPIVSGVFEGRKA